MNSVIKIFLILLKVLNYWFFVIPGRVALFAFIGYNLFIYFYFGAWDVNVVREALGGRYSTEYQLFLLFIVFPMVWSFFSMFAMTMDGPRFSNRTNSALDAAIAYRNGQMTVSTSKKAFEIYKDTAHLDVMSTNKNSAIFEQAVRGFNAKHGNSTPQKIFKAFTDK